MARNLPPLRVDPALLGGAAIPRQPLLVPELAKLLQSNTAHAATDRIAHPSTTPMSHVDKSAAPTQVVAQKLSGINDVEMVAEGQAELIRGGDALRADHIRYRVAEDEVESTGNVVLTAPDMEVRGPRMRMRMEESTGEFDSPVYVIRKEQKPVMEAAITISGLPATDDKGKVLVGTGKMIPMPPIYGSGSADRLEFRGEDLYHMQNASYSTCAPGQRDWAIHVDELDLDYNSEQGTGRGAAVKFMDVPIFYSPWVNFSLNNERKSGLLPGTIGSTNKSGFEVSAPWYWNISPNMDATITARAMSRRGLQLNTEFRHLFDTQWNRKGRQPGGADKTEVNLEYLPDDKLAGRDRYGYAIRYNQHFTDNLKAELNLNGVSDDDYFSDLSTRIAQVTQGSLLRQGKLLYRGAWYGAALNLQTFQSLQNGVGNYRRLPQVTAYANRHGLPLGLAFDLNAEYVNFDHPTELLGKRTTLYPQFSLPLVASAFSLTPKIGFHSTQYELSGQSRLAVGDYRKNAPDQLSRSVPIISVDGGFAMERDFDWLGTPMVQTLEPRLYYLNIPKRDQSQIPVFDTALASFNYAQIFSENRYAGNDRIGDANHVTLAVTSRLLDGATSSDLLRATLGTRYYLTEQSVTLPTPFNETRRTERKADILAALTGQVLPHVYADIGWQYNPRDEHTERLHFGGRYRPSSGQILNAAYRLDRSTDLKQFDVSGQWPLFGGWQGVGRYNYSINEHRIIESIGGVEYNANCWVGRFVVQRLATIAEQPTTAAFFQLELNDFSKIGSNPLQLLHRSIPGYGVVGPAAVDPSFANN
jgi:LPS-assembly protein